MTNDLGFPQILAQIGEGRLNVILLRGEPLNPEARGDGLLRLLSQRAANGRLALSPLWTRKGGGFGSHRLAELTGLQNFVPARAFEESPR